MKHTFKKSERLNSKKLIQELFTKGSSFYLYPFFIRFTPATDQKEHAILITVSKKKFKRAVDRNLIKRRVREVYRLNKHKIGSLIERDHVLNIAFIYSSKEILPFDPTLYETIVGGMEKVVNAGSGIRGYMDSLRLAGKTSTVQNPHGEDHSGFMGFAPLNNPKIAVAAYVENAGQGGRAAVSVASLLAELHIFGSISRPWLEKYVLEEQYLPQNAPRLAIAEN